MTLQQQANRPPDESGALPPGVDPDCTIWRDYPNHTCTDREGRPVVVGRSCWAAARTAVISGAELAGAVVAETPFTDDEIAAVFHVEAAELADPPCMGDVA